MIMGNEQVIKGEDQQNYQSLENIVPQEKGETQEKVTVAGVRFRRAGKIYYFRAEGIDLQPGDGVIVETARGIEFGTVVVSPRQVPVEETVAPLRDVLRKATPEDYEVVENNRKQAQEALRICQEKIEEHKLPMKLVDAEFTFDMGKILFYFSAEGRIDFRELVKDLAAIFRTRIELRQIGVRDEAKLVGGIGPCGRELCCTTWLGEFEPVSIRMAKGQNLSLNPTKISGICGRLMCCLKFENEIYKPCCGEVPLEICEGDKELLHLEEDGLEQSLFGNISAEKGPADNGSAAKGDKEED